MVTQGRAQRRYRTSCRSRWKVDQRIPQGGCLTPSFCPLPAGDFLSGKFDREGRTADGRRAEFDFPPVDKDRAYDVIDRMRMIASNKGCTVARVAISWLLHQPTVTSAILGATRPEQLLDNIGAAAVPLSTCDLGELDKVSRLPNEYPGWMLERQGAYRAHFLQG
ncbi:aldo/keto reductase [uncultured Marivita sp.]|uniref:aldo/keto reductase n=1 Tax=uncultured Marivita sp. TaxID=888080 RepID=UPI00261DA67B|nr:aldo/keto reductase [uncultured Marivita sp.]